MQSSRFKCRLTLNKREYREVLSRMESRCGPPENTDGRRAVRYVYQVADMPMTIAHPEGGVSQFLVFGRNVSRSGISVLHGGFVHPGSKCKIVLERIDADPLIVVGEVRHCRLFSGSCHEVGIRFDREIDPSSLIGSNREEEEVVVPTEGPAPVAVSNLAGSVLVADSFAPDHLLLQHSLSMHGLGVKIAETPGAALDAARRGEGMDLVLYGLSLSGHHGLRTLATLRRIRPAVPILILTAESDTALLAAASEAGGTVIMSKPYSIDVLIAQTRALLGDETHREPNYSTAAAEPGMPELIAQFVELVRRLADQVERTFRDGELRDLREYCRQLKGSGCGYGFQNVTVAAMSALTALDADPGSDATRSAIQNLITTCRSLALNRTFRAAE